MPDAPPTSQPAVPAGLAPLSHQVVLDALDYAVIVTDLCSVITFWNPYATTLYGWSAAEALGQSARELLVPELAREQGDAIMARLRAGVSWLGEFYVQCKNGALLLAHCANSPLRDAGGVLCGIVSVAHNVGLLDNVEHAPVASARRYRALVEHLPAVTYVQGLGVPGMTHFISPQIEALTGYLPDAFEGAGSAWVDVTHPADRELLLAEVARTDATGAPFRVEHRIVRRDGVERWVRNEAALVCDAAGEPLYWQGFLLDITPERVAQAALQAAEQRYRQLVEQIPAAIFSEPVGAAAGPIYMSPQIERILGYPATHWLGGHAAWQALAHPDDRERMQAEIARTDASGEPFELECRHLAADGRVVWTRIEAVLVDGVDGAPGQWQGFITDITERKRLEEELTRQAFQDALTGLPNRALLLDRAGQALARARRAGTHVALLFLDLDDFKVVNDSLGHLQGDNLIVRVAKVLQLSVRAHDTVARLGGDEFTVLLEDIADAGEVVTVVERIQHNLDVPFALSGQQVPVSASIGIVLSDDSHTTPVHLLRDADIAMYRAKASGKRRAVTFAPEMRATAVRRLEREHDLRRAVGSDEFRLEYQPKLHLATGTIVGVEALLRWQHPQDGAIAPAEFIPLAVETGLIVPLGRWVLDAACRQAVIWNACRPDAPLTVSVNLSARQFREPGLAADVRQALSANGLPPELLTLEITESAAMDDAEATAATLTALRALGVRLSIDDFGAGYSSLAYLQRFAVDTLKIDRAFIAALGNADGATIVAATIGLAHALSLKVVAEGVEQASQLEQLRAMGCDRAQGYLISRPLPPDRLTAFLAAPPPCLAAAAGLVVDEADGA